MKKIYFAPETIIVKVAMESLLTTNSLGGEASDTMEGFSRESDWED